MSFLASLAVQLIEWIITTLLSWGSKKITQEQQDAAIQKQAEQDADKLKQAQSDEDKSNAAQSIIDHTFGS